MNSSSSSYMRSTWLPTPDIIKKLILITCAASVGCVLFDALFGSLFDDINLEDFFSLSSGAYHHYYIWQILTYMFVQHSGGWGLSLGFFVSLAFNMYILWSIGSSLVEQVGIKSFLRFYFTIGVAGGIFALAALVCQRDPSYLSGPIPSILALLIVWSMLYPENEILLFFIFPLKAKWLMSIVTALVILIPLSHLDITSLTFHFAGIVLGYIYAVIAWKLQSPYAAMHPVDTLLLKCAAVLERAELRDFQTAKDTQKQHKIFDFKTGEPVTSDDDFVDAMLAKISKEGEKALTFTERKRLNDISQKRKSNRG